MILSEQTRRGLFISIRSNPPFEKIKRLPVFTDFKDEIIKHGEKIIIFLFFF